MSSPHIVATKVSQGRFFSYTTNAWCVILKCLTTYKLACWLAGHSVWRPLTLRAGRDIPNLARAHTHYISTENEEKNIIIHWTIVGSPAPLPYFEVYIVLGGNLSSCCSHIDIYAGSQVDLWSGS